MIVDFLLGLKRYMYACARTHTHTHVHACIHTYKHMHVCNCAHCLLTCIQTRPSLIQHHMDL